MLRVIPSQVVDLISPFPEDQLPRVVDWMYCYKTLITSDDGPQTDEEMLEYLKANLRRVISYGVIDKNNTLSINHPAPIIGMITFEQGTPYNGYFHITSRRKAWGSGLMDAACKVAIQDVMDSIPTLLRVSAGMLNSNGPAKGIAKRLGFRYEGTLEDFVMVKQSPVSLIHYGMTRTRWNELNTPKEESSSVEYPQMDLFELAEAA
jgi:RimJ/RimL family protein N-acetyltransferase